MITLKFIKRVPSAKNLVESVGCGNIHRKQDNKPRSPKNGFRGIL
jgi:hypothetical protein